MAYGLQHTQTTVSNLGTSAPPVNGLTPDQIVNSLGKFFSKNVRSQALDAATTGNIPPYHAAGCGGTARGSTANISGALERAGISGGLSVASSALKLTGSFAKAVPVLGDVLSSVVDLFGQHHAQAVAKEQDVLCQAVPLANQLLQGVDELFLTGQIDAQTASSALDQGFQSWLDFVKPIYKTNGALNAAYDYGQYIKAAMLYRKNKYQAALSANARGSNDIFGAGRPAPAPVIPAGATDAQLPISSGGWNVPTKPASQLAAVAQTPSLSPTLSASILGGFNAQQIALGLIVLAVLGFGIVVNGAILRKIK